MCLGIIGCFDYTKTALSSLLVSPAFDNKLPLKRCWLLGSQIFFACLATFSTSGASAIGYAYAAEIPQQRLRAQTAAWSLASSNLIGIMFSFCTPLMINGTSSTSTHKWGVKTGFLWVHLHVPYRENAILRRKVWRLFYVEASQVQVQSSLLSLGLSSPRLHVGRQLKLTKCKSQLIP